MMVMELPLIVDFGEQRALYIGKLQAVDVFGDTKLIFYGEGYLSLVIKDFLMKEFDFKEMGGENNCYKANVDYDTAKMVVEALKSKVVDLLKLAVDEINRWQLLGFRRVG